MLDQNVKEYEIIRDTMESIRQRLISHLSFTIGGSGIFYFAMNILGKPDSNELTFSLICVFAATLITSFFYLALYKFNSMNRYAGYCKLINIETYHEKLPHYEYHSDLNNHIITWEVCMGKLANTGTPIKFPAKFWDKVHYKGIEIETIKENFRSYRIYKPEVDKKATRRGFGMLWSGVNKKDSSRSWKYPLYSCYIYYFLISIFSLFSFFGVISFNPFKGCLTFMQMAELALILVLLLLIFFVLRKSFREMYRIMKGSKTVSAYCWKFLPYRIQILNEFGIKPHYYITEK